MTEVLIRYSLVLAIGILVLLDVIFGTNDDPKDDLTILIHSLTKHAGICIPFAWGVIIGHLYFGSEYLMFKDYDTSNLYGMLIAIAISALLALIGWWKKAIPSLFHTFLLLTFGLAFGHFFWTMHGTTPIF